MILLITPRDQKSRIKRAAKLQTCSPLSHLGLRLELHGAPDLPLSDQTVLDNLQNLFSCLIPSAFFVRVCKLYTTSPFIKVKYVRFF